MFYTSKIPSKIDGIFNLFKKILIIAKIISFKSNMYLSYKKIYRKIYKIYIFEAYSNIKTNYE